MRLILKSLFFLLLIVACYFLVHFMFMDSGYVLVAYNGYTMESSLWAAVVGLILLAGVIKCVLFLLKVLTGSANIVLPMTYKARRRRAQHLSNLGLIQFANGNWKNAQKLLSRSGDAGSLPLLNYLVAARAASANNDMDAYKDYLRKADQTAPAAYMAIGITQADIQMSHKQYEQALATLKSLRKKSPKHAYVLKLLKQTYEQLADWQALAALLPDLYKRKVFPSDSLKALEKTVYNELFEQAWNKGRNLSGNKRTEPADNIWQSLSKAQHRNEDLIVSYARCLFRLHAEKETETFIRRQLPAHYSPRLINIYGRLVGDDKNHQLLTAENLLTSRPNDPELMLALGRICARNQLWGKSREYLETSLKLNHSVEGYTELGQLLAHLGEHKLSTGYFQKGLAMAAERS